MKAHFTFNRFMLVAALVASLAGSAVQTFPVYAAGIVVNTDADTIADDGKCTLREAITAANTDTAVGGCSAGSGTDTITFNGNYTITVGASQLPIVSTTMTIVGNGAGNTILQAASGQGIATWRIFGVNDAGSLVLDGVTIRYGRCNGLCTDMGGFGQAGGAIWNGGALTVKNSYLFDNSSEFGGAIYNNGTLTITNTTFQDNSANNGGGIGNNTSGNAAVTKSTFVGNSAGDGCVFGSKMASESGTSRPLNLEHVVHRIRFMPSTFWE